MISCACKEPHEKRRIVLTGGPGAGKTAVLEMIRLHFCEHVRVLPEAAGILFGGGFPRGGRIEIQRAAQRAIFHVQRELEAAGDAGEPAIVLCDRGTVDGLAYWTGTDDFWSSVGSSLHQELQRYDLVIHLHSPDLKDGYNRANPLRVESAADAAALDARILQAWERHPRRFIVDQSPSFLTKAARTLEILRTEMPECCRQHVLPLHPGSQA